MKHCNCFPTPRLGNTMINSIFWLNVIVSVALPCYSKGCCVKTSKQGNVMHKTRENDICMTVPSSVFILYT